jgi:ketosteroid isomerase-like protein
MSQKNVETVRAMTEAYNSVSRGDLDAWIVQFFDPEIEWHDVPALPGAGVYHGHDAFRRACERYLEAWSETRTKIEEIRAVGDRVVACVQYGGIGQGSGARVVGPVSGATTGAVFDFRNGRILRALQFESYGEALEAVGLDAPAN